MPATPESKVKAKIKAILAEYGAYYAMPIGTMYGNSGVPDFLCCLNGKFIAIEAKAGRGRTTALQDKQLGQIRKCGGYAIVVSEANLDELTQLLRDIHAGFAEYT